MIQSLTKYQKNSDLNKYVDKVRNSLGINKSDKNLHELFKGKIYKGEDLLDEKSDHYELFTSVIGDGQGLPEKTIEEMRNLAVISWQGRLKYRNYNSYKIFTNGIATLIDTSIERIMLQKQTKFENYEKGFYSFHVPTNVFMAMMEGFGLLDDICLSLIHI